MYDFKDEPTGEEFSYELLMKGIEDSFYRVRDKVIEQSEPLSKKDKYDLFMFAAAMHVRTPAERNTKEFHGKLKEKADWILENHSTASPEERNSKKNGRLQTY